MEIPWDKSMVLTDENIKYELLTMIVQNIFRKAQVEKEYCIFYGDLCEKLIKLELGLRDLKVNILNMKKSSFRLSLFDVCKQCFEKFFKEEEIKKMEGNLERQLVFKTKLYGNLDFVGELYRRKMLPDNVLVSVFYSLLGISEINNSISDLNLEGAILLMNKVGEQFEERSKIKKKKTTEKDQLEVFQVIIDKFQDLMDLPDEDKTVSVRIKLLIKNMFANRESGWEKTKNINEGGPKTKKEVQNDVQEKYDKERQAQDDERNKGYRGNERHGGGRNERNDRYEKKGNYNDRNDHGRDGRDGRDNKQGGGS